MKRSIYPSWIYFVVVFLLAAFLMMFILVVRGILQASHFIILSVLIGVVALWLDRKMSSLFARSISDE